MRQQQRPRLALGRRPGDEPTEPVPPLSINCALTETSSGAHPDDEFNQLAEECAAELAGMITFHGYPSSILEDKCFRSFVHGLNPQFQMPSRAAVEGICHSRSEEAMRQLKETLVRCSGQISLVADTIETGQGRALYMACHFIDDEWAFHKRIMQVFRVMRFPPYGHSALLGAEDVCLNVPEVIQKQFSVPGPSNKLEEAVRRWGLAGRLFSVAWGGQQLKTRAWNGRISSRIWCTASPTRVTCWT